MKQSVQMVVGAVLATAALACVDFDIPGDIECSASQTCPDGYFCDPLVPPGGPENGICRTDLPTCGNGILDPGEVCDDGNQVSGDGCRADCLKIEACGDGIVDYGQACDEGGVDTPTCNADCTLPVCGDGYVNAAAGQECDEGGVDTPTCNFDCTLPVCGDGHANQAAGQECDDGGVDSATCNADCTFAVCGDGYINEAAGQQCEEGAVDTETCNEDCTLAFCGDGHVNEIAGQECDDGGIDTATCNADCTFAVCGDGYVNEAAGQECDLGPGNNKNTGACLQSCQAATCGDGFLHVGTELCDPGIDPHCNSDCRTSEVVQVVTGVSHTCALRANGKVRCWGRGANGRLGYGNEDNVGDSVGNLPADVGDVPVGGTTIQITAGFLHTCALLDTGNVRCWGAGSFGRLGYGNTDNVGDSPDNLPSDAGDVPVGGTVVQISAGGSHTCALLDTGNVRCWGFGLHGPLGYGNTDNVGDSPDNLPFDAGDVPVGGTVVQISAGDLHTCALLDAGNVRCWGNGGFNRLGYDHESNVGDTPDNLPSDAGDVPVGGAVVQIVADSRHTCALLDTGSVRCWGSGREGRLGYGNTSNVGGFTGNLPSDAGDVPVGGTVVQLSAGGDHTCALLDTGSVRCWGAGVDGRLGYGNESNIGDSADSLPADAGDIPLGGTAVQIAAGGAHTCALLDTGRVRCWGRGDRGKLGYGSTTNVGHTLDNLPSDAGDVGVGAAVVQIASGAGHACALRDGGTVRCWGVGSTGRLGYGDTENVGDRPENIPGRIGNVRVGGAVVQLAGGDSHTCALLDAGSVRCWGQGAFGRLGYGHSDNIGDAAENLPDDAGDIAVGGTVVQVAAGGTHTCALLDTANVRCWGSGHQGRLGYGHTENVGDTLDNLPSDAGDVPIGENVIQIAAGQSHTCALLDTGNVRCWGQGTGGKLGYGNTEHIGDAADNTPAHAGDVPIGGTVVQITAGTGHTCALLDTGNVRCWGAGSSGRLGYGNTNNVGDSLDNLPSDAGDVLVGGTVVQVAAGSVHTCVLLDTGRVRCWGAGSSGRLGYGNTDDVGDSPDNLPADAGDVPVGGIVVEISAGGNYTCALLDTGNVRCWGNGFGGNLGYGNTNNVGDTPDKLPADVGNVPIF
jgi:cysteine-rich repeat protein